MFFAASCAFVFFFSPLCCRHSYCLKHGSVSRPKGNFWNVSWIFNMKKMKSNGIVQYIIVGWDQEDESICFRWLMVKKAVTIYFILLSWTSFFYYNLHFYKTNEPNEKIFTILSFFSEKPPHFFECLYSNHRNCLLQKATE